MPQATAQRKPAAAPARKPTPAASDRARLIKLIHVARRELKLDEPAYRAILQAQGGADSSAQMTLPQLRTVLDYLKRTGFKVTSKAKPGQADRVIVKGRRTGMSTISSKTQHLASDPESRKARAMWLTLHAIGQVRDPSEAALLAYTRRLCKVDRLEWVTDAVPLIESLKSWLLRSLPAVVQPYLQKSTIDWAAHTSPAWKESWGQATQRLRIGMNKGNLQLVDEWVALWELVTLAKLQGEQQ